MDAEKRSKPAPENPLRNEHPELRAQRKNGIEDPAKRNTLKVIGGIIGSFASGVGSSVTAWELTRPRKPRGLVVSGLSFIEPDSSYTPRGTEYADLCYQMFLSSVATTTDFVPPDKWRDKDGGICSPDIPLPNGTYTYGHEAVVLRGVTTFLKGELDAEWDESYKCDKLDATHSQILLGSGASNETTAWILGSLDEPRFENPICKLHYGIGQGTETIKRWQYGRIVEPRIHTICDAYGSTLLQPESNSGVQTDDYLMVTRLPGSKHGTATTVFSGLHGPGTRSAELLFSSISLKELRALASIIDPHENEIPYFQAIFRASNFLRSPSYDPTDSDIATALELVINPPPRRLDRI